VGSAAPNRVRRNSWASPRSGERRSPNHERTSPSKQVGVCLKDDAQRSRDSQSSRIENLQFAAASGDEIVCPARSASSLHSSAIPCRYCRPLTELGLAINAALAVPNQGRLGTIIELIDKSDMSIHDLSGVEVSRGVPRFDMPVELGLALYRSHKRSTSEVNGSDPKIHKGTIKGLMSALRYIFISGTVVTSCG
jgi:hypothetical protein